MTGCNRTHVAVMDMFDDGIVPVVPKRCRAGRSSRAGKKNAQGTSPKVRIDRLKQKVDLLYNDIAVLQARLDDTVRHGGVVLAERDSARAELKAVEIVSRRRLLIIQNEVPDFARKVDDGTFECYAADCSPCVVPLGWQGGPPWQRGSSSLSRPVCRQTGDPSMPRRRESP